MGNLGATELILIFLVVLLLFGARRIPEIARGLGKGIREFKDATSDVKRELMVDDTRRLQTPTSGQPLARGTYETPQYAETPAAYAPPQGEGYAPSSPTGPSGDPNTGIPSTGVPGAPYPPMEANDQPPLKTPPAQG